MISYNLIVPIGLSLEVINFASVVKQSKKNKMQLKNMVGYFTKNDTSIHYNDTHF